SKQGSGSVARAIVDTDDSSVGQRLAQTLHDIPNRQLGIVRWKNDDDWLDHSSSSTSPSIAARIPLRSASIDSTVCESSAARAALLNSPLFRYSSIFCRAPSIVYFSVYNSCRTSMISSISLR